MGKISLKNNITSLNGQLTIPGDKSISHRSIIFGAIANGKTTVKNFLLGDDCINTIKCFQQLGVRIKQTDSKIVINGLGFASLKEPRSTLNVGNSGTTIRLLLGLLSGCGFKSRLIGDDSIAKRPMTRVTIPLKKMGATIEGRNGGEYTPLIVKGGNLQGIQYKLPVASAQVKSAILLAGLQANGKTTIIEKEQTRDHTERMIRQFGGKVNVENNVISIDGNQRLKGTEVVVPGDISSAAFFLVAAAIIPDAVVTLRNVGLNETRTGIIDVMKEMGANITVKKYNSTQLEPRGDITVKYSSLQGVEISGKIIPRLIDELPIIALLATQAEGPTIIKDAEELKVKETNRIDAVVKELQKLGANIESSEDGMVIKGKTQLKGGQTVTSYGDHRIGMMLAIASLICQEPVYLEKAQCINISYPQFFSHLDALTK